MRILMSAALCVAGLAACDTGPQFSASVTRTATVGLQAEDTIVLNTPVSIDLQGARRDDLSVELTLTVTASSADVAEREAERIEISVSRSESEIQFGVGGIDAGFVRSVSGTYTIVGPRDLNARIVSGGATVSVEGLEGDLAIETVGSAQVLGAEGDVAVRVGNGNAIVETDVAAGTTTDVFVQNGSIELRLPFPLNARVVAAAQGGSLLVDHPGLGQPVAGLAYDFVAGMNLATVLAATEAGNVVLQRRP